MKKLVFITALFFISMSQNGRAQDSLLAMMKKEIKPVKGPISTFKSTRIINAQTNETLPHGALDVRIAHRFGNFLSYGDNGHGGFHNYYGLDDPNFDIRLGFEYGISNRLMIGVSRSRKDENMEGLAKYALLRQTTNGKTPVSITLFGSIAYTPKLDPQGIFFNSDDRLTYTSQAIIARKFSSKLSLELIPSLVHRNFILSADDNTDIFSIGGGGRCKVTKSLSIIADYYYNFRNDAMKDIYYNPLGLGVEIETAGHVFSLMFTNAQYIIEPEYIANTTDTWSKNGWKLSFNISRVFQVVKN